MAKAILSMQLNHVLQRGNVIVAFFVDGHMLVIVPHYNSLGQATCIEEIRLVSPQRQYVFEFYSPFQNPVLSWCKHLEGQQFGFDYLPLVDQQQYDLETFLSYLLPAWESLQAHPQDSLSGVSMWELVQGSTDLVAAIQAGEYHIPQG